MHTIKMPDRQSDISQVNKNTESALWLPSSMDSTGLLRVTASGPAAPVLYCEPCLDAPQISAFYSFVPVQPLLHQVGIRVGYTFDVQNNRRVTMATFPHPASLDDRVREVYPSASPPYFAPFAGAKYSNNIFVQAIARRTVLLATEGFSASHDPLFHLVGWLMLCPAVLDRLQQHAQRTTHKSDIDALTRTADNIINVRNIGGSILAALRYGEDDSSRLSSDLGRLLDVPLPLADSLARGSIAHFRELLSNATEAQAKM